MEPAALTRRIVRFGTFELYEQSGEIRTNGVTTRLSEQPLQILLLLLERPGEVVTREQLRERLWPAGTFVDFDTGLNSAVRKLREALGDSAENPRYIETLPRRGYRLVAAVEEQRLDVAPAPVWRRPAFIGVTVLAVLIMTAAAPRLISPAAPVIASVAVLPFTNLSGDRADDYLADGLTDELIIELAQLRGLRVISRTSIIQYRHSKKPLPQIAKELNVDAVVEGSVARAGKKVRLAAQLVYVPTDRHVWARAYERNFEDVESLRADLGYDVIGALGRERRVRQDSRSASQRVKPKAYDSYLRSHISFGRQPTGEFQQAIAYADDAIAEQPDFALAHAARARYYYLSSFGRSPDAENLKKAEASARRALELDPNLPLAHKLLANIQYRVHWNWRAAEIEFRRAIELSPGDAESHGAYSVFLLLQGRTEEALRSARRSTALDPLSSQARQNLGRVLHFSGRHAQAIDEFRQAVAMEPGLPRAHYLLGRAYLSAGDGAQAAKELEIAVELSKGNSRYLACLGYIYGRTGRTDDARSIIEQFNRRSASPMAFAVVFAGLEDREQTLRHLEAAGRQRAFELADARELSAFEFLYGDARFEDLMRKVGLPAYDSGDRVLPWVTAQRSF